jgi:site-specific DNA-methyltransferase (adenine-specific)
MSLWDLRCGRWQDALVDVKKCDAVICDPPYSRRTHEGALTTAGGSPSVAIDYARIDEAEAASVASWWVSLDPNWIVVFSDHVLIPMWAGLLESSGFYVFAPVGWVRPDGPRIANDGPCSSHDYITIARPRGTLRHPGSRPGKYVVGRGDGSIVGQKDLTGMRAIVRDYSRSGDLIVDPFAGSGSTLLAASIEGRRSIGAEMRPEVYEMARKRLGAGYTPGMF